jgi:bis(5'-nucleosyl)-tetraphosphatase (symmetrical)
MAIFAIGDIQGCWIELQQLLDKINFDPEEDTLWFTGDLVNRGPGSLETLRFVKKLGHSAITVLGNHELHLLAIAYGKFKARKGDTFEALLNAHDRDELIEWIRHLPLMHQDKSLGFAMVHAGLPPQWSIKEAASHAKEVEKCLQSKRFNKFLEKMYGDEPAIWSEKLEGWDRLRFITNGFTRIRYCDKKGHLNLKEKGTPGNQPKGLIPWFELPDRQSKSADIVFGHWSSLGFRAENGIYSLDTGCLWGGQLTALRLDGEEMYRTSLDCLGIRKG